MTADDGDIQFLWDDQAEPAEEEIGAENARMERRRADFRLAAEYVAQAFSHLEQVRRVSLFGSVARHLKKEIPPSKRYSRARVEIFHECRDIDMAVWMKDLASLDTLRRARSDALKELFDERKIAVAHHQVDVFLFEAAGGRYAGRLCIFGKCPKGKFVCKVPGCGKPRFLQQHEGFVFRRDLLAGDLLIDLFSR